MPADDRCKSRGQYQAALVTLPSNEVLVFDLTAISLPCSSLSPKKRSRIATTIMLKIAPGKKLNLFAYRCIGRE